MNEYQIQAALIAAVSVAALVVMAYWWLVTSGAWREWPAGRSLMILLAVVAITTANAAISFLIGYAYPGRFYVYMATYALTLGAIVNIGLTVRSETRKAEWRPEVNPRHSSNAPFMHDKFNLTRKEKADGRAERQARDGSD